MKQNTVNSISPSFLIQRYQYYKVSPSSFKAYKVNYRIWTKEIKQRTSCAIHCNFGRKVSESFLTYHINSALNFGRHEWKSYLDSLNILYYFFSTVIFFNKFWCFVQKYYMVLNRKIFSNRRIVYLQIQWWLIIGLLF